MRLVSEGKWLEGFYSCKYLKAIIFLALFNRTCSSPSPFLLIYVSNWKNIFIYMATVTGQHYGSHRNHKKSRQKSSECVFNMCICNTHVLSHTIYMNLKKK